MTFVSRESRTALVSALHELVDRPVDRGQRPPVLDGACVLPSLLAPAVRYALAEDIGAVTPPAVRPEFPVSDLGKEIDGVASAALFPVQVRTRVRVCLLEPCAAGGSATFPGDAAPYAPDRCRDGWWTGFHLVVPLTVPDGTRWVLHGPDRDHVLSRVGGAGLVGPRVHHTLEHRALAAPLVWLDVHTTMHFRPSRHPAGAAAA